MKVMGKQINIIILILSIIGIIILTLATTLGGYMFVRSIGQLKNNSLSTKLAAYNIENDFDFAKYFDDEEFNNILFCGIDKFNNTDVIMIICINQKQGNIKILRIPRDIYIGDHYQTGKINSVLSQPKAGLSGEDTLTYELNNILRLKIDKYVFMDLDVFEQLIDDIGGVTVNLSRPLKIDSARTIKAGRINLDGKLGADFVRHRKSYLTGDIGRIHAQEQFIRQFAIKFRDGKYMKNMPFLNKYYNLVETNIGRKEVGVYTKCFENAKMEDIRTFVIEGTPVMHNGYSVYVADLDKTVGMLNKHFMPEGVVVKKSDIKLVETLQPDLKNIPVKESDHSLNKHYLNDYNSDVDIDNESNGNMLRDKNDTKYTNYNDDSLEEDNTRDDFQDDNGEEESYVPFEE